MRLITAFLVTLLSGVPATAVVCDLLLCDSPQSAVQPGCHEHETMPAAGERLTTGHGCDHLAAMSPSVVPSPRHPSPDAFTAMLGGGGPARVAPALSHPPGAYDRTAPAHARSPLSLRL